MSLLTKDSFEKKFDEFFNFCKKEGLSCDEVKTICRPLLWSWYIQFAKKVVICLVILLTSYALFQNLDCLSWMLSAIGRLLLIKLLPYWDWTTLYNSKCLVNRVWDTNVKTAASNKYETDIENCALCEELDGIPTTVNTSYSLLEHNYLESGHPVIVMDSHKPLNLQNFLQLMLSNTNDFLNSEPCDLATNLMLKKFFAVDLALRKIQTLNPSDKWFLQLRNCQFKAVKSSRRFVTRPYYYPVHMEPYYSSWILMSNNYSKLRQEIYLYGLIFVQQLSGFFDMLLKPRRPCENNCPVINIRLDAGECLVFSTDIWVFSYGSGSADNTAPTSIATILEIDWHI